MAVLRILLAHFGRDVPTRDLRRLTGVSRDCVSALEIKRAAEACGLRCRVLRLEPDGFTAERLPMVAHLGFIHFVVVEAFGRDVVGLNCPSSGRILLPRSEFDRMFTGVALAMTPGPDFVSDGRRPAPEVLWWSGRLTPCLTALTLGSLAALARGGATVWIVLHLTEGSLTLEAAILALGLVAVLGGLSAYALRRMGRRFARALRDDLATRLQVVPAAFHHYRLPDVLYGLFEATRSGSATLTERIAPAVAGLVEATVLLGGAVVLAGSAGASLAVVFTAWCIAVVALTVKGRGRERAHAASSDTDVEAGVSALLEPGQHRLGTNAENFRTAWLGRLARHEFTKAHHAMTWALLAGAPLVLAVTELGAATRFAPATSPAAAVLAGAVALAAAPLAGLRSVVGGLRRFGDRAADVLAEPAGDAPHADGPLRGAVLDIRRVRFRHNPNGPALIDAVSLHVGEGEQVGLGGPSGAGKSTLAGIAVGLHRPEAGEVLFGEVPLQDLRTAERTRLVALVDRTPVVFEGTVRENLTLGDSGIDDHDLRAAIADAALDAVLAERPGGLDAPMEMLGRNFSGGQLRRLEIARALARNPRLLVLDDAVDDIDLATELRIRRALRRRGCALLLLTHRAASLAGCNRVVRLERPASVESAAAAPGLKAAVVRGEAVAKATPALAGGIAAVLDSLVPARPERPMAAGPALPPGSLHAWVLNAAGERSLSARPVQLYDAKLLRFAFGPVLGFRRDGTPVLLSTEAPGARVRSFGLASQGEANRDAAEDIGVEAGLPTLAPVGYEISPVSSPAPKGLTAWSAGVVAGRRRERVVIALASGGNALACVLSFIFAASDARISCALAAVAAASFWRHREVAADRYGAAARRAGAGAILDLLGRVEGDLRNRLGPGDLALAIRTLLGRIDLVAAQAGRGMPSAILAATALIAMTAVGGAPALLCALVPGGMFMLASLGARRGARASEGPRLTAGRAAWRRLLVLLFGMTRLRLLGADAAAFARWRADDDRSEAIEARQDRLGDLAAALRDALCLGLVTALAGLGGSEHGAVLAGLGWLLAFAMREIGRVLAQDDAGTVARGLAAELLGSSREDGQATLGLEQGTRLTLESIDYRYPVASRLALSALHLSIDLDRITVLTGPSGGGKSTALQIALGFLTPCTGSVRLDALPLSTYDLPLWRRRIAAVFQGDQLDHMSTIRGHLCGTGEHGIAALWQALNIVDLAEEVAAMPMGIQTIVGPMSLSAGQQQRLLIARAILDRPRLLVLDEATNAIPDALQARLLDHLRESGIGCLAVTHRETLVMAADVVHVIDRNCRFSGPPTALLHHPDLLARLAEERAT